MSSRQNLSVNRIAAVLPIEKGARNFLPPLFLILISVDGKKSIG